MARAPLSTIRNRPDFLRANRGLRVARPGFVLLTQKNDLESKRFGVTVTKKVGNAVVRNRMKRRLRALAHERRRDWVTRAGSCAPSAPMWTSRAGWLDGLSRWAHSPAFGQLCAEARVSITTATLQDMGFDAAHLREGFSTWEKHGGPVEYPEKKD